LTLQGRKRLFFNVPSRKFTPRGETSAPIPATTNFREKRDELVTFPKGRD